MKQTQIINVSKPEYEMYIFWQSRIQNIQIPGFRQAARSRRTKKTPMSGKAIHNHINILQQFIGPDIIEMIKNQKVNELLKGYTNVKDVMVKVTPTPANAENAFNIEVKFTGEKVITENSTSETEDTKLSTDTDNQKEEPNTTTVESNFQNHEDISNNI